MELALWISGAVVYFIGAVITMRIAIADDRDADPVVVVMMGSAWPAIIGLCLVVLPFWATYQLAKKLS
jgi:hypothetical protein